MKSPEQCIVDHAEGINRTFDVMTGAFTVGAIVSLLGANPTEAITFAGAALATLRFHHDVEQKVEKQNSSESITVFEDRRVVR